VQAALEAPVNNKEEYMSIFDTRIVYAPLEYPQFYEYFVKQNQAHWTHLEINMSADVSDWKSNLTDAERGLVGHILKGFITAETVIGDYWSSFVARRFKKPEIVMMANAFAAMEGVHMAAYAQLNETLGLKDYDAFLHDPSAKAKIDRLTAVKGKSREDVVRSLAIFSAFTEGVSLFSSFAILLNFSRFNKLKGLGQIISMSIRDESTHSVAGVALFNQIISEFPALMTDSLKKDIYNAARATVELEDTFIDKAFDGNLIEGITAAQVKNFIRARANQKLNELGLKNNWKNIDKQMLDELGWFDLLSTGVEHQDFFAQRSSSYSTGVIDFSGIFDDTAENDKKGIL
jgi:ribonucleoside-diphosphate reductase beta chain